MALLGDDDLLEDRFRERSVVAFLHDHLAGALVRHDDVALFDVVTALMGFPLVQDFDLVIDRRRAELLLVRHAPSLVAYRRS